MAKGDQYFNNPQGFSFGQGQGQPPGNMAPQIGGWLREILQGRIFPPSQPNRPVVPQPNQPNVPYNTPGMRIPPKSLPFSDDMQQLFNTNKGIWG